MFLLIFNQKAWKLLEAFLICIFFLWHFGVQATLQCIWSRQTLTHNQKTLFPPHVTFSSTMVHLYWIIIQELSSLGCLYTDIFYLNISFGFRKGLSDLDGFCLAVFSIRGLHYSFSHKSNYIVLEFSGKKITCWECNLKSLYYRLKTHPSLLAKGFFFNSRNVSEGTRIPCGGSVDFTHEYFYKEPWILAS